MNTKLTLTIEKNIIEQAKRYARMKGKSLSGIIENYLIALTREKEEETEEYGPIVTSLKGSFRKPRNYNYKKELSKKLNEKYF